MALLFVDGNYKNSGIKMTAVTLNAKDRRKYEKLFGDAVIKFSSLCIDKCIGEGEQYALFMAPCSFW